MGRRAPRRPRYCIQCRSLLNSRTIQELAYAKTVIKAQRNFWNLKRQVAINRGYGNFKMNTITWIRALFGCGWSKWLSAVWQVFVIGFISLFPLLISAFRDSLAISSPSLSYNMAQSLLGGQLIFYSMGFISTVAWDSFRDWEQKFPLRSFFGLSCILGTAICCAVIGDDPLLKTTKPSYLAVTSLCLFVGSSILYVLVLLASRIDGKEYQKEMHKSAEDLTAALNRDMGN